jgi:cell wall-associated NlpC family hydrolase
MAASSSPSRPTTDDREALGYQTSRQEMKTGDVLMFAGRGALSSTIRDLTGSEFSHAGLVARWGDRVMVFESAARGVELMPASRVVCKYDGRVVWYRLKGTIDPDALINEALNLLRLRYSFWGLVRFAWKIWTGGRKNRRDARGARSALFCSEFVSRVFRKAGLDLVSNRPDDLTSPGDIARSPHLEAHAVLHFPERPGYCKQLLGRG